MTLVGAIACGIGKNYFAVCMIAVFLLAHFTRPLADPSRLRYVKLLLIALLYNLLYYGLRGRVQRFVRGQNCYAKSAYEPFTPPDRNGLGGSVRARLREYYGDPTLPSVGVPVGARTSGLRSSAPAATAKPAKPRLPRWIEDE